MAKHVYKKKKLLIISKKNLICLHKVWTTKFAVPNIQIYHFLWQEQNLLENDTQLQTETVMQVNYMDLFYPKKDSNSSWGSSRGLLFLPTVSELVP